MKADDPMTADHDLAREVEAAIEAGTRFWLPRLGRPLADRRWRMLRDACGVDARNYGTARARHLDPKRERDVQARIDLPEAFGRESPLVVETLRADTAARYVGLGLDLALPRLAGSDAVKLQLQQALDTLASVPEIAEAIGPVLQVLHVVTPEGPDYDVSYSDPEVPFSVFVGVAAETGRNGHLRLAESILHECMHLQLTLVEDIVQLVSEPEAMHFSPWQDTMRPVRGVLHGIYVFAVIRDFMDVVQGDTGRTRDERDHAEGRLRTASGEISLASESMLRGNGLSGYGRMLVSAFAS